MILIDCPLTVAHGVNEKGAHGLNVQFAYISYGTTCNLLTLVMGLLHETYYLKVTPIFLHGNQM